MQALAKLMTSLTRSGHGFEIEKLTQQEYEWKKADSFNAAVGNLNEEDGYDCPKCKNKGWIATVVYDKYTGFWNETHSLCQCRRIRNAIHRLNRSGLENVVKKYTFDQYLVEDPWQTSVKATAVRFCKDDGGRWFFMGGQSGAGKSHICTAITVHFIRQGLEAKYMLWRDEIEQMKRYKANSNEATIYADSMKELKTVPVLYIDDLFKCGKGPDGKPAMPTTADVNAAFEIINHRYNNPELITIISSERTLSELTQIDEAIAGRIAEKTKAGGYCLNIKRDPARNWRMKGIQEL